jgi:hypothetical protein
MVLAAKLNALPQVDHKSIAAAIHLLLLKQHKYDFMFG